MPYSSNDHRFTSKNLTIYAICQSIAGLKFVTAQNLTDVNHKCDSLFVPKTETEFENIFHSMDNFIFQKNKYYHYVRFWTDYSRTNQTHFWSQIANNWWSQCQSSDLPDPNYNKFNAVVSIDGYKMLRNQSGASCQAGCICIGKG